MRGRDPVEAVRRSARPIDDDALVARCAEHRIVLLGEATHGSHEFYAHRAGLTRRLIVDAGFDAVVVEADWPDAAVVDSWVRRRVDLPDADAALGGFTRFPGWMWRNTVVRDLVDWLRAHNDNASGPGVSFHGLDLYSLRRSAHRVVTYLETVDPEAAERARRRYACLDHSGIDAQQYGYAVATGHREDCEDEVVAQLLEMQRTAAHLGGNGDGTPDDDLFDAEQNARLVADAEQYYRSMFRGGTSSWNLRDQHMADTLDAVIAHRSRGGEEPRVVVWAHNSHVGDARATEMGRQGELNLGQLARERHGEAVISIGYSTYGGEVTAASGWDGAAERKRVRPALRGSYEHVLHSTGVGDMWLDLSQLRDELAGPRLERAIGVVYRPETERVSHYFESQLPEQFDVIVHVDETTAVVPLEVSNLWERGTSERRRVG